MTEAEDIDSSIEYLETKVETLKKIRSQIQALEEEGADVHVLNPSDTKTIRVIVKTDDVGKHIKDLAEFDQRLSKKHGRDKDITYDYEEDIYKLERKFFIE